MLNVDPRVYNCIKVVLGVVGAASLALGVFLMARPKQAIERQIKIYRRINWKMEPISWDKEIRNTRLMGVAALFCGVLTFVFIIFGY